MEEIRYLHNLLQRVHLIQVYSYKFCIYEWYLIVCIDHVVVMPDPVPYLSIYTFESLFIVPSSLPLNSVNSARSNLMTLNSATNPLGLIQYGDTNMNTQISTEPTVSGSYASSGVPFSYVTVLIHSNTSNK